MSLTDRDRKIVMALVPLLLLLGYYFLLLKPKREEAAKAGAQLAKQEKRRDKAVAKESQLGSARTNFAADYQQVVRLGKAVPASVDLPSLIVQLDRAAAGTGISFDKIATGTREEAPAGGAAGAPGGGSGSGGGESKPADAGGEPAQSGAGQASENAGEAAQSANADGERAAGTGEGGETQSGGVPVGGGAAGAAGGSSSSGVAGLDTVPLEFEFRGSFFDLADFFHRLKRFVRVANDQVLVRGRLMTIDAVTFKSEEAGSSKLTAEVTGTVYLAPRKQGATAGATPRGPGSSVPTGETPGAGTATPTTPTGASGQ